MALGKLKENWLGFVTVGLAGGLVLGVFTAIGTLTRLDTRQSEMGERLNRIAAALPDVSVRIAQEETKRPLDGAVVVSAPVKTAKGEWVSPIHFINTGAKHRDTYLLPADGPDDRTAAFLAAGIVVTSDKSAITMRQASAFALRAKEPAPLPDWVQGDSSYVLFKDADHLKIVFEATLTKKYSAAMSKGNALSAELGDWMMLSAELRKNGAIYTAAQQF